MADQISKVKIVSFNCNSIRTKVDTIRHILKLCDILICQETILIEEDSHFLQGIDQKFYVHVNPSKPPNSIHNDGRPCDGMVMFYSRHLAVDTRVVCDCEHFSIYKVSFGSFIFHLANIYLPCDSRTIDSLTSYQCILGELQSTIDSLPGGHLLCMGDFNDDPFKGRFWPYISDFSEYNNLIFSDMNLSIDTSIP